MTGKDFVESMVHTVKIYGIIQHLELVLKEIEKIPPCNNVKIVSNLIKDAIKAFNRAKEENQND